MSESKKKNKVLLCLPLPPPYSGVETLTQFFLKSPLSDIYDLVHIDTSNKRSNDVRGKLDWQNITQTLRNIFRVMWAMIWRRPQIANIPIARNRFGFLRDGAYILICSFFGAKVVSRMTGDHFNKFYHAETPMYQRFARAVLRRIDTIIVRADRLAAQFEGLYPPEQIETVYLPFDPGYFDDVDRSNSIKNDDEFRILFMGHVSRAKGALDLLESLAAIIEADDRVRLVMAGNVIREEYNITHIGDGDQYKNVDDYIADYGQHLDLIGIVSGDEKNELICSADLLVLPSYSEGFPFAVLEAMCAQVPVVATEVGALPEVFTDGKDIRFVPISDANKLADVIIELIADEGQRGEIAASGRKMVEQRFNLEVFGETMSKIYDRLL